MCPLNFAENLLRKVKPEIKYLTASHTKHCIVYLERQVMVRDGTTAVDWSYGGQFQYVDVRSQKCHGLVILVDDSVVD